ncbi:antibiotic biosynthesis monooxygenase [Streptomyces sp. NPDC020379]|uniref:antibiotic biosynthesis monooxygenase n=1 Tax=Streptomyces sp. NPDC020379 TaxID=3365071 RepID=UPI0037B4FD6E
MDTARTPTNPVPLGIHHLKLPVTDLERSARWYGDVLGAHRLTELDHRRPGGTLFAVVLDVPGLGTRLELRLDPVTATAVEGYDFLTLAVDDRTALDRWIAHLDTLDVPHSPPVVALVGWLLVIPDPDGQRLRLYTTTPHGLDSARIEYDSPWLSTGPAPEPEPADDLGTDDTAATLCLLARITAVPGQGDLLESRLLPLARATRREPGCIAYRVHRSQRNADAFVVYEEWTGRQALDAHHATPHMNVFRAVAADLLAAPPHPEPLTPCPRP